MNIVYLKKKIVFTAKTKAKKKTTKHKKCYYLMITRGRSRRRWTKKNYLFTFFVFFYEKTSPITNANVYMQNFLLSSITYSNSISFFVIEKKMTQVATIKIQNNRENKKKTENYYYPHFFSIIERDRDCLAKLMKGNKKEK